MGPAKAAIDSIGGYFAVALARYGVTVNMVNPGMSDAGLMLQTPREVQDAIKEWAESGWTPMRRRGSRTTLRTFARCSAAMRPGAAGRARALYSRAGDRLVLSVRSTVFFNRRPPLLRHSSASWSLWSENWIWTGRPPTAEEIEALVGPGTTGIGAINTSAVRCPIRTIAAILERHGMEPAPGNVAQAQRSVAA